MEGNHMEGKVTLRSARAALTIVFLINVQCAVQFIVWPQSFMNAYELSGIPGMVAMQGLGVAFLMWNATYPVAIAHPEKHRTVYSIVLVQQAIGLIGESAILTGIPAGHELLSASIARFIAFDAGGLILMGIAFAALLVSSRRRAENRRTTEERQSSI